ncbi:MAG: ATP-binding protein [Bacteroidota bacterium]
MYSKQELKLIKKRIEEETRRFIQVIMGPRQVGKTTLLKQFTQQTSLPYHFVAADAVSAADNSWIAQQWEVVRTRVKQSNSKAFVLIFDEIQKVANWSEMVKKQWDYDSLHNLPIKVILLGSSRLLLQQGLTESLAGRYELTYLTHWTLMEMQDAFGFDRNQYIYFGGYPGAADLIQDEDRWRSYVKEALIESSISKDILMLTRVDKPALMRNLFEVGTNFSGQELSFNKILGQLQDAGNTTTLSHYLQLLNSACLLGGLEKYSPEINRKRASSPKFQVYNNALLSALQDRTMENVIQDPKAWGRWVESAIGAHLINESLKSNMELYYWRDRNYEVDFVLSYKNQIIGLEVKSNLATTTKGMSVFQDRFQVDKVMLIGEEGLPIEDFLKMNPLDLF